MNHSHRRQRVSHRGRAALLRHLARVHGVVDAAQAIVRQIDLEHLHRDRHAVEYQEERS
jgi:hypothetical protein